MSNAAWDKQVDALVIGSGLGALTAAVSLYEMGAKDVLVVEKADKFGGTSALSGGVIWTPCNRYARALGQKDSVEEAHAYLKRTIPEQMRRDDMLDAYLRNGPQMVDFLHERTHARYMSMDYYPDYHSHIEGSKMGNRALEPEPFDSSLLGADNAIVSHGHRIWYMGDRIPMTIMDGYAIKVRARGWQWLVTKAILRYAFDWTWLLRNKKGRYRANGSAAVSRLYLSLKERGVEMWRNAPMMELVQEDGRVTGAVVMHQGTLVRIRADKGLILASGGFEHNQALREQHLPKPTDENWSAGVRTNTGDALIAGQGVGAATKLLNQAWWNMTANIPGEDAPRLIIIEKALPGCCLVNREGNRFLNESQNYQTLVEKLYEAHSEAHPSVPCWLIFDARYRRDYILGPLLTKRLRPDWTFPKSWHREGFIAKARTIADLARKTGIDPTGLEYTIAKMNGYARTGIDLDFHRGETAYDRLYGDPKIKPNPNLAPLAEAPFYAMRLSPGDIGTQGGLVTDVNGQVMDESARPIPGLYASGNCTAAVIPTYPGAGATLGPAMVFAYQAAKHMTGYNA
ncbi:MAG: FAD-dependent oxidoreductase [Sphingobium sp.]